MVSQVLSEAVVEEVEQSLRPAKVISVLPCSGIRIVYIMPRLPLLCAAGWGELGTKGEQLVGPAHVSELSEAATEEVEHSLRTAKVISVPPPPPRPLAHHYLVHHWRLPLLQQAQRLDGDGEAGGLEADEHGGGVAAVALRRPRAMVVVLLLLRPAQKERRGGARSRCATICERVDHSAEILPPDSAESFLQT